MLEIFIVLCLVVLNGVFALSELAIVSARRAKLRALAKAGRKGARSALALADDPGRFLSTVQIGITLVGILAGAFSGATLGIELEDYLIARGLPRDVAEALGLGVVIVAITYLSLIIGELVPKNLALRNAEAIACAVAPMMTVLARVGSPLVWLLDSSTKLVLRLTGQAPQPAAAVTEEEIKTLVAEAESAGVLESDERQMIAGVLRLGDRAVLGLMTPRTDVDWIDLASDEADIRARLISTGHSRLPVGEGSPDAMIGVVQTRELLAALLADKPLDVRGHARQAPIIPETMDALDVLQVLREAPVPMALIHDEYGNFEGLVTPADILEAIAGVFHSDAEGREPYAVERDDGSWILSGAMPADEMAEMLEITLPGSRDYQTVAGFVLALLHHLPVTGESVAAFGWRFEVVDLDGRRIDKVLATRIQALRRRQA
ncbi:MAG: hemolysin family protein [Hyphomicrobium sp.]|uniref:hemolysin family protein n=1 Tax=Hyphomicrobium sp. TaxID=82 RepID=UPI00132CA18D|nr:hemolysin family protein [Hyphomicrobium sp.]KAB2940526.1 MAG: HlyC/CorC family transporter [Hyphomicrobium sp.]MBZ0210886.1 hemolysin family protein [Hyphomicrobium sp.]